jgi:transaldolase / glucose-6-phosphate isomerase
VSSRLTEGLDEAEATMRRLSEVDISMQQVTDKLIDEGVVLFADAFDRLMSAVEQQREDVLGHRLSRMSEALGTYGERVNARLDEMQKIGFVRRLWDRDPSLFVDDPNDFDSVTTYMGWLHVVDEMLEASEHLIELQEDLAESGATHVMLMGMGGSSLAPEVFRRTFGAQPDSAELVVLDSTVPAQVKAAEEAIDIDSSVFLVASKSGTTVEPNAFNEYFWRLSDQDGSRFIAITDPDTALEALALEREFLAIYAGDPEIGGRYSALSPFGMVPAAAMGLDPLALLERARTMVGSCEASVPPAQNSGVRLGAIIGELALAGRDKLTIVSSVQLVSFGAWLEQLIAESTGKLGRGIVPVDGEDLGSPDKYGNDRVFAFLKVMGEQTADLEKKLDALEKAGHPVLRFELGHAHDLVQEMFRWEIATATAGHVLKLNPFDQPNVQESKDYTKELLLEHEKKKKLPAIRGEVKVLEQNGVALFTDQRNEPTFAGKKELKDALAALLGKAGAGDYVALNAYVEMSTENERLLHMIRHQIRDQRKVATTVGFGPRFLHSTGQLHKGGPNSGVFLQITCDDEEDLQVPEMGFTFGTLKSAQQAGDFMALSKRERRLVRIHLGTDVKAGLTALLEALG